MPRSLKILLVALRRFGEDDGWAIASHIALASLTSLFPFLIFVTALAGFFGSKELADQATVMLLEAWPRPVAEAFAREIQNVLTESRGGLLTIGAVLALYFSSSAVEALRIGLNRAYAQIETRSWWWLRLESMAYVLLGAATFLTMGVLLVLGPLVWERTLVYAPEFVRLQRWINLARYGVAALVTIASLVMAHKFLAAGRRTFKVIAPGVAFTLVFSLVFAEAFGVYLAEFSRNYVSTYAGLASVMIALGFLYTLSAIFVFGAEINAAIMAATDGKTGATRRARLRRMLSAWQPPRARGP